MLDKQRYSFTERTDSLGRSVIMPYIPLTLTLGDRSVEVTALPHILHQYIKTRFGLRLIPKLAPEMPADLVYSLLLSAIS
jgi:hypothetical protein